MRNAIGLSFHGSSEVLFASPWEPKGAASRKALPRKGKASWLWADNELMRCCKFAKAKVVERAKAEIKDFQKERRRSQDKVSAANLAPGKHPRVASLGARAAEAGLRSFTIHQPCTSDRADIE